jgi:hypothetical protein
MDIKNLIQPPKRYQCESCNLWVLLPDNAIGIYLVNDKYCCDKCHKEKMDNQEELDYTYMEI